MSAKRPSTPGRMARGYVICAPEDALLSARGEAHWGGIVGDPYSCKLFAGKVGVWLLQTSLVIKSDRGAKFSWRCASESF